MALVGKRQGLGDEGRGAVRSGSLCGSDRRGEPAGSGASFWHRPANGGEDAGVFSAARVPAEAAADAPEVDPFTGIIDAILAADEARPKKQRHTAKRIFERVRDEHGYAGGITIVKDYVRAHRLRHREVFVPLRQEGAVSTSASCL